EHDWARIWEQHLEGNVPYMLTWLAHQANDPYWRPASVQGQYDKIACPVFVIGAWRDGYPNPPLRLFEHLRVPRRVLIGPWDHSRPDAAVPGPRIHYLHEMRRWFDHWLKGRDTGVMREPPITVYMQRYDEPRPERQTSSGEWRYVAEWPAATPRVLTLFPADEGELRAEPPAGESVAEYPYVPTVGVAGGLWSGGLPVGLPSDQRVDEALSLTFTSAPLNADVALLGRPRAIIRVSSTAEVAAFVVKLSDVAPDGKSALITRGVLNGTRRQSFAEASRMVPGAVYDLSIDLDATGWIFDAGHRVRLTVASADFPNCWPTPFPAVNRIWLGGPAPSRLVLPLAPAEPPGSARPEFLAAPSGLAAVAEEQGADPVWEVRDDVIRGTRTVHIEYGRRIRVADGTEVTEHRRMRSTASRTDPAHATAQGETRVRRTHRGATTEALALGTLTSSAQALHLTVDLEVLVEGRPHFHRRWAASFPRLLL
ncbi:MAG: CocE/NonD family hydrolase, partial [Candidatus Rokuibacteriota bacterium]